MSASRGRAGTPERLLVTTENAAFQVLDSLIHNRTKRHRHGSFVVEGVIPITRALDAGWAFDAVIHRPGARLSTWARDVVARSAPARVYEMAAPLMARLSGRADDSELLAVLRMPAGTIERIAAPDQLLVVVVDRPANPGNLGTVIRSCDAFGAHGVITTGHAVDIYDPGVITASRGSLFAVPVVQVAATDEVAAWLHRVRERLGAVQVVGAEERAPQDVSALPLVMPTVLVVGNEARGLSRASRELCDTLVRIPMSGGATSLNLAVATSVVLYEVVRQRRLALAGTGQ